ncbi:MAG: hypothetical protein AABX74_03485, partial [Nanoarchaeota archaeon]
MVERSKLEELVSELFDGHNISEFSLTFILDSPRATEDSIRQIYSFLSGKGLTNEKIATLAQLLGRDPET